MNKLTVLFTVSTFLFGCSNNKLTPADTFFVNYQCKNDTLLSILKHFTSGKVGYYDNEKKLQIVSLNYITEEHPGSHYFKIADELPGKPAINTIKYEISFNESMINDSIAYSLRKLKYTEQGWQNLSDMGTIKVFDFPSQRDKYLRVIKKNVASTVVRTIVTDSYAR